MKVELKKWSIDKEDQETLITLCNTIDRSFLSDRIPDPFTAKSANGWLNMVQQSEAKKWHFSQDYR